MAKNDGKVFEQEVKASFPKDFYVERYKDIPEKFRGVNNPADFWIYKYPLLFLLELKSHKGKSIPFDKIRENQVERMLEAVKFLGIYGGFLFNFRDLEETYYVPVAYVYNFMENADRKSIPVDWCREMGTKIDQKKKKVRYTYDLEKWLEGYYAL